MSEAALSKTALSKTALSAPAPGAAAELFTPAPGAAPRGPDDRRAGRAGDPDPAA